MAKKKKLGDCFEAALQVLIGHRKNSLLLGDAELVHGYVTGQGGPVAGERYTHAWIELSGLVIDPSNDTWKIMPDSLYYEIGEIDRNECRRYSKADAIVQMITHQTFGPWEIPKTDFELADDLKRRRRR